MQLQQLIILFILLFLPNWSLITAKLRSSDTRALLDFAAAVPHAKKLNWHKNPTTSSVCIYWVGVTCTYDNKRVIALRLPSYGFFGPLPPNTLGRLDALASLSLRNNYFTGDLPSDVLSLPSLRHVYLERNNFSGTIPSVLSTQLVYLDLSFNSFTGNIPVALGNSTQLVGLNLQNNSFSGSIPDFVSPRLRELNLRNNNLNGSIPSSLQFFNASSFEGNTQLCGVPLDNECPSASVPAPSPAPSYTTVAPSPSPSAVTIPPQPSQSPSTSYVPFPPGLTKEQNATRGLTTGAVAAIAVTTTSAVMFLLFFLVMALRRAKKKYAQQPQGNNMIKKHKNENYGAEQVIEKPKDSEDNKLVFIHQYKGSMHSGTLDMDDLLRASAEVLGKGTHGTTYKVILEDGATVVVKRLKEVAVGKKEFEQLMEDAGKVDEHPNIVSFWGYYYSKDEKLHVYDFLAFGSLHKRLHGGRRGCGRTLDWETRVKILQGAAKGIAHIHYGKLSHGNIKASNILLKQDMSGCISDFGITPTLMGLSAKSNGYRAPEINNMQKSTQKADIYSFGVVLLEILTGKVPSIKTEAGHEEAIDLPMWVQSVVREEWTAEVFDIELIKCPNIEGGLMQMLQIAMACVETEPEMRPSMDQVVETIEEVRQQYCNLESKTPLTSPEDAGEVENSEPHVLYYTPKQ